MRCGGVLGLAQLDGGVRIRRGLWQVVSGELGAR